MKKIVIALVLIVLVVLVFSLTRGKEKEIPKLEWTVSGIGAILPIPDTDKGKISIDNEDDFTADIQGVAQKDYEVYVQKCKDSGFTVDSEIDTASYKAYNKDGCFLSLKYSDYIEEYHITLEAPKADKTFVWPTLGLSTLIPTPKSNSGVIEIESSRRLLVYVCNTTFDEYSEYIDSCIDCGFNVDYNKGDKYFNAHDTDDNSLNLDFIGFNTMSISLYAADKSETTTKTPAETTTEAATADTLQETTSETVAAPAGGIDSDFKAAMDSYEAFFDEYIAFMKKYNSSNDTLSLLADYTDFLTRYSDTMTKMNAIDENELTTEEAAYYTEVTLRISQKLLAVS